MKKFLLLVIMCAVGLLNTYAQTPITIGDGSTESQVVPLMADYEYNLSQQIYLQEEIGIDAGTISSIAFYASSNFTKNISVYMVNTDKSSFTSSNGDFIALPEGSLLYEGEVNFKMEDWTTIEFQTPFSYTGSNLMLCVYDHTGEYIPVAPSFKAYSATDGVQRTAGVYSYGALLEEFVNGGTLESVRPEKFWDFSEYYDPETVAITRSQIKLTVTTNEGGSEGGEEPTPGETQLITLGSGDMSSPQIPFNTWYNYAISQQIYTAEELAAAGLTEGTIKSIGFKSAHTQTADRNVKIYMLNTDKAYFTTDNTTSAPMEAVTADNLVYDGTMNIVAKDEWFSAEFTTPFEYTGSNILVYFVDYTQSYTANECLFYTYATENYTALYDRQDNEEYLPYDSHNGLVLNYKNQVQFGVASGNTPVDPTPGGDAATTFALNFDDGTFTGWRTFDAPGAYCLGWQTDPEDPFGVMGPFYSGTDGTKCAVSISSDPMTATLYKPDSYLVTADAYQITATSKLSWNVKFPFSNGNGPDYYEVVVSTDNETFNSIWSEEKYAIENLQARELNLSEYAGQTLYIGFRHYRETSNANAGFIAIDDVVLSSEGGGEVDPEPQAPAAPANLVAEAAGTNSIVLTWDAVEGATTYKVYDEYDVIATTEETTYTVEGLSAATNYCFVVTAANEAGESFASAQACATTDEEQGSSTAQTITIGEDGAGSSAQLPTNMFYNYSLTQQIYTGAEMNYTVGDVTKVAFYQASEVPAAYSPMTRDIVVYMLNTEKEYFSAMTDWVPVTSADIVYEGTFTTSEMNTWVEIELQTPFAYAGGNFVLCIHDVTGSYANEAYFKTYEAVPEVEYTGRTLGNYRDGGAYNINDLASEYGNVSTQLNSVQLTINSEPGLSVNPKDGINFGTIQLGNYWPEKAEASVKVTVGAVDRTVASITTDNDFFVLPEIDMTATPITFNVGYNKEAAAGTYNGTLTVTAEEGDVVEVPMTAVVYDPVEPDVFELAREISFTNDAYSDTPDFATLHDDYVLPNEGENGLAPDAVYTFTLEGEKIIKAEVEGEGGFYAIYRADSIGEGKGPQANNNYNGVETILSTTFEYDFEDETVVNDFTVQDLDEFTDFCWGIENGQLVSYSFYGWYDEDGNWAYINKADERIITNNAYTITPNTVLTFDMQRENSSSYQNVTVEITKDGQEFTSIRTVEVHPDYWDDYKEYYPEDFDENGNYISLRRINLGEEFIAAGLEYGDYRISLRANNSGAGTLIIDNLALTERAGVYEAGDYYMVAAAKEAFTLNVELQNVGGNEPVEPEVKDYRIASIEGVTLTEYTYESENSNKVVEISSDGLIDVLDYNEDGTLAGYTTTSGTEVITEVEYIYENGRLAGYSEVAQGWTGPITEDATFVYNAEGQITEIVSSKMTTQLTYNAEGLVTEKLLLYGEDIDSKEVYDYENGRLIRNSYYGYDSWETMDFYLGEVYEYEYDVNGNCIKENQYLVNDDESWTLFYVNEISHNMTVAYEDVFYFEYPHLAILNPAKPSHNNIITREFSYYQYEDNGEFVQHSEVETIYNYNPELPADEPEEIAAPTNLVAELTSSTEIKLTWDAVEGAVKYGVYLEGGFLGFMEQNAAYIQDIEANTTYCFTVTAFDAEENESEHSNEACVTTSGEEPEITAPTNITAVATGPNSILLSWDPVEGAAGYGVYVDGEWLGGFLSDYTEYEFESYFDPETTYCFTMTTVTEIDAEGYIVGETEPSEEVCATTEASSVLPPANVEARAISDTEIELSWDAAEGALGYGINLFGEFIGGTYDTSVVIEGLSPDTEYCFSVYSITEIEDGYIVGFTAPSEEVCEETQGIGVEEFSTAFNIYPNPVNDVLFIENGSNIEEVSIYTITGVMVYNEQCVSNNVQVNVSEFEAGVYIIKVRTENNEIINRFVKK